MARLLFTDVSTSIHRGYSALCRELNHQGPTSGGLRGVLSFRTYGAEQARFCLWLDRDLR
jgi:hypothetical protein